MTAYVVRIPSDQGMTVRLIQARNRAQVRDHLLLPITIDAATPDEIIALLTQPQPVKVEYADPDEQAAAARDALTRAGLPLAFPEDQHEPQRLPAGGEHDTHNN